MSLEIAYGHSSNICKQLQEESDGLVLELLNYQSIALQEGASKAVEVIRRETAKQCAEIAHNWRHKETGISCSCRLDIEKDIKKQFGLDLY